MKYSLLQVQCLKAVFLCIATCVPEIVSAGDIDNATIAKLMLDENNGVKVYVDLSPGHSAPISCFTNGTYEYVLDISTPFGEKTYAALLSLYAVGKVAKFVGRGDCNVHGGVETLRRIEMK